MKFFGFIAKRLAADCARPSDTLAAEKNFSDAYVVRKMISLLVTKENPRLCRGEKKAYGEGRSRQEKVSELE